jgi:hypothetical protein
MAPSRRGPPVRVELIAGFKGFVAEEIALAEVHITDKVVSKATLRATTTVEIPGGRAIEVVTVELDEELDAAGDRIEVEVSAPGRW